MRVSKLIAGALLLLPTAAFGEEGEEEIPLEELPAAVREVIAEKWPGSTLLEAERSRRYYDVEFKTAEGERLEVEITAAGEIKEIEREDEDEEREDGDGPAPGD